jgi:hypothetical protein
MAGRKIRYKIRFEDGTIRTVVAQSYKGAKEVFICRYQPPIGSRIEVWPDKSDAAEYGIEVEVKRMKIGKAEAPSKKLLSQTRR